MSYKTYNTIHSNDPPGIRPQILTDLLELAKLSKHSCLKKAIEMISDLQANGMNCRYKKHLGGPIYELKSRAEEGGARVYFFQISHTEFALCRAECKTEDAASAALLNWTPEVIQAARNGIQVLV